MPPEELPAGAPAILPLEPIGSATAPFIYFDGIGTSGFNGGVGNITLEALRYIRTGEGKVLTERVVVAQLRMSQTAMIWLANAMNAMVLQAAPPASDAKN